MSQLKFVPHDGPQVDFFITSRDTRDLEHLMASLGATRDVRDSYTAYIWNERLGSHFLSGSGVLDDRFYVGPRRLTHKPRRYGCGNYTVVDLEPHEAHVTTDPFGYIHNFYSDSYITNRLHLAALSSGRLHHSAALSLTYDNSGFSFGFNCLQMPVDGVKLLPVGHSATIDVNGTSIRAEHLGNNFDQLSPSEYWDLIEQGADEIVSNVQALMDAGLPVFSDITGGRDSRLVFGAIVASGATDQAIFNTIANPTTEALAKDLEIATGLVARYGGSYGERPRSAGHSLSSISTNLMKRRSQAFGSYHWIIPADLRPISTLGKLPTVRMLGGGGEVYRDRWHKLLFNSADIDHSPTDEYLEWMLRKHRQDHQGTKFSSLHFDKYLPNLLDTFRELPGTNIGHKLDSHFLNFRNRSHFGPRQSLSETLIGVSPASSPKLLAASRGLPSAERVSGRVIFDTIRVFDEKLAYLPFDSPSNPAIFSSPYHRASVYDDKSLDLTPALHLVEPKPEVRNFPTAVRPVAPEWDFESMLDREIEESLERFSSADSQFHAYSLDGTLDAFVSWSRERNIAQHSAAASKLRAFADFDESMPPA